MGEKHQFDLHCRIIVCEFGLAAGGPEELDATVDEPFDPVVLLLGLKRYKVHASFPSGVMAHYDENRSALK